jgi:hypothetical protein
VRVDDTRLRSGPPQPPPQARWRVLDAIDAPALARLRVARAAARELAWAQLLQTRRSLPVTTVLGRALPGFVLDIDATIVLAHSEKQAAAPTWKHSFGFHPLLCFLDATGEALAGMLRPGNAGSNTAADHVTVVDQALQQLRTRIGMATRSSCGPIRRAAATSSSLTSAACASTVCTPSSPSGSRSPHQSGRRSPPPAMGWRRSTATAACATARNWSNSPTISTPACWPRSRPARG